MGVRDFVPFLGKAWLEQPASHSKVRKGKEKKTSTEGKRYKHVLPTTAVEEQWLSGKAAACF